MPMPKATLIKPTHKALKKYYAALQSFRDDHVTHEGALETAFQRLLEETAKSHGWKLIPKQKLKVGKQTIYPDGTLRDLFNMRCGFWEAKDTDDKLDADIQKKNMPRVGLKKDSCIVRRSLYTFVHKQKWKRQYGLLDFMSAGV